MKPNPEIWNELLEISPLVANIPRQDDLFSLPAGYFDQLAGDLLTQVLARQADTRPFFLNELDKNSNLPIPGNYFENLPARILALVKGSAGISAKEEIQGLSPVLDQIDRKNPFSLPAEYFNSLSEQLMAGLLNNQTLTASELSEPVLSENFSHENPYKTPEGYFESLPELLLIRVNQNNRGAKVIALARKRTFLKYAAAAVIAGALLIGGSLFFNHPVTPGAEAANPALTAISDQEILNYMEAQNVPLSDMNSLATVDLTENDGKDLLSDVSDEELQQYLNDHVTSKDQKDN
jgi:hypothetical protein